MSLFKKTPDKMYKAISKLLYPKDGKKHILVDIEPTNSLKGLNDRVNGVYNAMIDHQYTILSLEVMPHLRMQTSIVIIYK